VADNFKGNRKMKIRGKWVIILTVFVVGIIIGSIKHIIPDITNKNVELEQLPDNATIVIEQIPIEQIQHVDNNKPENEESRLATQLKEEEENEIKRLNAELAKLEVYVSEQKKEIESWYSSELERLKLWADSRTKELDGEEKLAYARFLQNVNNTETNSISSLSSDTYVYSNAKYSPYGYSNTDSLARTN
jgi:uncharacterized membrane-anchored protein YhcB (DUF1043 family)